MSECQERCVKQTREELENHDKNGGGNAGQELNGFKIKKN